ncbi:MAG: TetR/AcrR family transcriptional regulator [Devosia sp.]
MKVSKQQATENRERILVTAARLFREGGIAGVGVDAVSEAASLTHGSVYSQFGSKDRLAAEALSAGYAKAEIRGAAIATLHEFLTHYLSAQHRDNRGSGCFMAALGGEMPRQTEGVRKTFTAIVKANIARISQLMNPKRRSEDDDAVFVVAAMVGAMVLSRAVDEPGLSDRIIKATRRRLDPDIARTAKQDGRPKATA